MINAAFTPVAQALTPVFTAFCTNPSPAPPPAPPAPPGPASASSPVPDPLF
jgi:hypothetical protein